MTDLTYTKTDKPSCWNNLKPCKDWREALETLKNLYAAATSDMQERLGQMTRGEISHPGNTPTYPYLALYVQIPDDDRPSKLAFGHVDHSGWYGAEFTHPDVFKHYLSDQLRIVSEQYEVKFFAGPGETPIPLAFALDPSQMKIEAKDKARILAAFPAPNLNQINDAAVDGTATVRKDGPKPLTLFTAERVDYSLRRLQHYTGTHPEHFQRYVIFTNYQRYVDEFIGYAKKRVKAGSHKCFVEPGNRITTGDNDPSTPILQKMPQMPAYHLVADEDEGITLVNIGVGPSNAKTITDHIAVLRPHVWLMVGHCGGLRRSQALGDYVLAHAYLRDDHVLDEALPVEVPIPSIAEVQIALTQAVSEVTGFTGSDLKHRLRTGTVVTTDDRNWELRQDSLSLRLNQSRAVAIDMESATIAANGYRFRVPYGTLLCVSDRPMHGEIKLPGVAEQFYEERVSQHLDIALRALSIMHDEAQSGGLHSRKLRSFNEAVFR